MSLELPVAAAIEALRRSFSNVTVDSDAGIQRASGILSRLRMLNAPAVVQDVYVNGAAKAVMVAVCDTRICETPIEFMLMPGEGIQLKCADAQESLAGSIARSLGYECEEIG